MLAVKNTNNNNTQNPAGYYRISVTTTVNGSGEASANAGAGLLWKNGADNDDFQVIITSGSGDGDVLSSGAGFSISGTSANTQTIALTGLSNGGGNITIIGTVYSSDRSAKAKTTERMKVLKIDDTTGSAVNGLTTVAGGFGSRVDDSSISLGTADVFKIKAIFESKNSNDPVIPNFSYTNLLGTLAIDDVIQGDSSGSRARIVSTTSNIIYFVPVEDDVFTAGETITAPNATLKITGSVDNGSTNITSTFDLDDGQRDQYYDYSRIVRKAGFAPPTQDACYL